MMHRRGKMGAATASDTWVTPLPVHRCCVQFFFSFFISWYTPTQAETHRFRPYRHQTGQFKPKFKKKKKKVQNAPFELNNKTLNYISSQPNSFFNLQLSHSLCSPIPSRLSALHLPSLKDALSYSLRHILTLLFFAWLSVSSSPQVSSSPHLTDPLSTKVSN